MNDVESIKRAYGKILSTLGPHEAEVFLTAYDKEKRFEGKLYDPGVIKDSMSQATRCVVGGLPLSFKQLELMIRSTEWSYTLSAVQEVNSRYVASLMCLIEGGLRCGVEFSGDLLSKVNSFFKCSESYLNVGVAQIDLNDFPNDSMCLSEIANGFRRIQPFLPKWVSRELGKVTSEMLFYVSTRVVDEQAFERVCLPFVSDLIKVGARGFSLRYKLPAFWPSGLDQNDLSVAVLEAAGLSVGLVLEGDGVFSTAADEISEINENGFDRVHNCILEINKITDMVSALDRAGGSSGEDNCVAQAKLTVFLPSGKTSISYDEAVQAREAVKVWRSDLSTSKALKLIERGYGDI